MFNTTSKYQTVTNCNITLDDYRTIVKYYQPIVGTITSSVFLTLISDINNVFDNKMNSIKKLQKLTSLSLDDLYNSIIILSKVGLLNLYLENGKDDYIIDIIKPKGSDDFFMDSTLSDALRNYVGDAIYTELVDEKKRIPYSFSNYKLINETLNDVVRKTRYDKEYYIKIFIGLSLKNNAKELEDLITFSYTNKLTMDEINDTVSKTKINGIVNVFLFKSTIKMSKLSKNDVMNASNDNEKIDSIEEYYKVVNSTNSEMFLARLNNGRKLSSVESNIIKVLRSEYQLSDPVINVLIDYVFKVNNMMLNRSLVESIAASWQRNEIATSSEAISFVKNYNNRKKQRKVKPQKQVTYASNTPDWLLEQIEEDDKKLQQKQVVVEKPQEKVVEKPKKSVAKSPKVREEIVRKGPKVRNEKTTGNDHVIPKSKDEDDMFGGFDSGFSSPKASDEIDFGDVVVKEETFDIDLFSQFEGK